MKRAEILEAARVCVCGERERDYGTPENNFETIGLLWGVYLRAAHPELARVMAVNHITPKDVAAMMGLLKVARIATGSSPDSFVDLAGYAACAGEIAVKVDGNGFHLKHLPVFLSLISMRASSSKPLSAMINLSTLMRKLTFPSRAASSCMMGRRAL